MVYYKYEYNLNTEYIEYCEVLFMKNKKRVKGFTLIEMIVVIAIIGILAAIVGPSMSGYYRRSRLKTSNADAKMVYNAAQTAAQNFMAQDRVRTTKSELNNTIVIRYIPGNPGTIKFGTYANLDGTQTVIRKPVRASYANESDYNAAKASYDALDQKNRDALEVVNYVNKTVSDGAEKNWCIVIEGYMVKAAISANGPSSDLVGYYTANRTQATDRSNHTYEQWIADGPTETIKGLVAAYGS